jgi:hypothetical protein
MLSENIKCTAITASGKPCKAWAIRDSAPPRCAPHSGLTGAPKGNTNAVTHGYYRKRIKPEEIDALYDSAGDLDITHEAVLLRVLLHRLAGYLNDPDLPLEKIKSIAPLIVSTSRALGYLQKLMPDPHTIDWDAALDELGKEWGWDL